ncbi:LysR family transcriptional regulator [Diaphorobacter aerolatus]|uniref:LysR family transcriptional regulator n=1 Tax=Diaphorobacter aerolatus TaxID=1288495 RepID=A0A7H0GHU3_9BURK|nr:LysR family transcriptional regulator [Diaphorobacter aerolatus]QNP47859.1 LysR family transcriptional regulator [Diaphorobacter aerolatus]
MAKPPVSTAHAPLTDAEPRIGHRHIEVFRAVMLAGGVTGAARLLYTSQPTISRELARLESLLGYALFDRVQGRLRATAKALSLWDEVQRSWQGLDHVIEHALALAQPNHSLISVLSMPALSHALLPGALARLHAAHGPLALSVATQDGPLLLEWMSAQRFDIGLTEQADAPPGTRAIALPALDEVAVLPAAHPLARKRRLKASDFAGLSFISLAREDQYRQRIDAEFARAGVERQLLLEAHSAIAICAMVQHGLGVAIVNPLTARACEGEHLVVRPLAFAIAFQVQALLPLHRPAVAGVDWLLDALAQEVAASG